MKREVVVKFEDVKNYIKAMNKYYVEEIIDSVEPFVMYYVTCPVGFAETDELNDINQCVIEIDEIFNSFFMYDTKRERNQAIRQTIKTETTRWKESKNAWAYGRYIGRLAHLINENKINRKSRIQQWVERNSLKQKM